MSIADKLTTIAENEKKVYDAGAKRAYDLFWDAYQQNGLRTNYTFGFVLGWDDTLFKPKYDLHVSDAYYMFHCANITDLASIIKERNICFSTRENTRFQYMLMNSKITKMPPLDLSSTTLFSNGFYYARSLMDATLTGGNEITNWENAFYQCLSLVNLKIDVIINGNINLSDCKYITMESLQNVLDALKDRRNESKTFVCTLGKTNLDKLSNAMKEVATDKGWTLV